MINKNQILLTLLILTIMVFNSVPGRAMPAPLQEAELIRRSDVVLEGRVIKVSLFDQWLAQLKGRGILIKDVPTNAAEMLKMIRNFPYKKAAVVVDGVFIAEVEVDNRVKGNSERVIYIPFVKYHFVPGRQLVGPWSEREYLPGEHLKMYLQKNGPFFESTWWNGVQVLTGGKKN